MNVSLDGIHVALVTPMLDGGEVDHDALRNLAGSLIERGVHGLVPCGSTGESATLSHAEHIEVVKTVVDVAAGKVPVIAGTGSNSTREAIRLTAGAKEAGADAALLITPYYNKPTQAGLFAHFEAIANATDFPLVLYNIPGRAAVSMHPETVARLAELPQVAGIKDATGSMDYTTDVLSRVPDTFRLLAGDDAMLLPMLSVGGHGVISVVAHLVPERMLELYAKWQAGDAAGAAAIHHEIFPLIEAVFAETNPMPIKEALYDCGAIPRPDLRLPLVRVQKQTRSLLRNAMAAAGLDLERSW